MLEPAFFDTNLFLYAYSRAPEDQGKRDRARELFEIHEIVVSAQVIQEFVSAALRRPALGIDEEKLDEFLACCATHLFQTVTFDPLLHATALRRRFSFSHWDSTILAAAHASGCRLLYSEDLHHGFSLEHLRVVTPFVTNGTAPIPPP